MDKKLKALKSREKGKKLLEKLWELSGEAKRYCPEYHKTYVAVYQHFLINKRSGE